MKRIRTVLLPVLLGLASCTVFDSEDLKVVSDLPSGVVEQTTVIQLAFNRGVVDEGQTNQWTDEPFIEFTPPIPGKFVWQDTTRLVFSPDGPLPGDVKFHGKINKALLLKYSGLSSFSGADEFEFSTESFTLKSAEFFYDRIDNKRTVGVKANLEFTYPVKPEDVAKYLRLSIDDEEWKQVVVVAPAESRIIPIEIGALKQLEKERTISVDFDKDLTSSVTNTRITMDDPLVYKLPGLEELKVYGHQFGFEGTQSWIKVTTSQEVDLTTVKSFIAIEPARAFSVEGEGMGFILKGSFEPGTSFKLLLKKGLESVLGAKLQHDYLADIIIGNIAPSFGFASESGVYMLLGGRKMIDIKTVNISELNVRISQIFKNNLVHFLDGGRSYDWDYEYNEETGEETYTRKYRYYVGNYGRQLDFKKLTLSSPQNQELVTPLDLSPYLGGTHKGFFLIDIANTKESWRSTSKLVSVSDLGLIVKRSQGELLVFVVSLETNQPLSGVEVTLVSTNNQQMGVQRTDSDGLARFPDYAEQSKTFALKLVTAEKDDDFNFIHLEDYRVETSRFDVGGKSAMAGLYDAFLYGDRTIYRPGEKIIVSGIVRNLTQKLPVNMPVRIQIENPRGTVVSEQQRMLNEQGSFEIQYQTQHTSLTGDYGITLMTGDKNYLASYRVSVEDFVPDRLRVNMSASAENARPGDKVTFDFQAFNFFGPPAAGRNYEFEGTFDHLPYRSEQFPDFWFHDAGAENYSASPEIQNGITDEEGRGTADLEIPKTVTSTGLVRARGRVGVFDESGRPVYQLVRVVVYPKDYFIGLKYTGDYYIAPHTPQKISLVAVDANDKPIPGFKARVQLIRYEWHSVLRQHPQTQTLRYVSEKREIVEKTEEIVLQQQPTEYTFTVSRSGEYVVRVAKSGDKGYNQVSFYSYSWATADVTSFRVNPEAKVEVVFDKKVYAPGDRAKVLFQTPFAGTMLVTVERNKVFSYRYITVSNNSASLDVDVLDDHLPNVYVGAVLFRKIKDQNIPLMAGHGFAPLMVEKPENKIAVTITAPEKMRSKRKQTVSIKTEEKDVYVTLAAVDEGVLQVKGMKTPDPYGYFYAKKALETATFDFFRDLIPEPTPSGQGSVGGGDEEAMAQRVSPMGVQRFKPLSLWSGILKTRSDGLAEVTLDIPEFNGEIRLMAVAYKGDRFGSAEKAMKVADPVILTPSLPRFLSPNDIVTMPITAFNTTEKPVTLDLEIQASGGLSPENQRATLDVGPNQERQASVTLKVGQQIGKATVVVRTTAFGERVEAVTELPIRPVSPFMVESLSGVAEAGKPVVTNVPDAYYPFHRKAHIVLSPFPVVNFARQLKHLVGYPHGCLEQTVSKAFPQIYLRDIALLLDPDILASGSPSYFVNEAITKVNTMQMGNGAFAYWPGANYSNDWSTVFATHFLLEARKAGYAVQDRVVTSALTAVAAVARSKSVVDYSYYAANRTQVKRIANKNVVYALYVLALGGSPDVALMNFYRREKYLLTTDTQYLLAGAFALSGDRAAYLELVPAGFVTEEAVRTSGGDFDSPLRANALILNILLETDQSNPNIARYTEYLSKRYRETYWFSTQDNAFTLLAFGKLARMASATKVSGTVTVGDRQFAYSGGNEKIDVDPFGQKVTISVKGEGRVFYSIVTQGIRKDGAVRIEDKNLRVRREFFDRAGNAVESATIRQNDLLVVRLTVSPGVDRLDNVAISDLLPAGFEIENPRLTEAAQYSFIRNPATPEYMDIRDDRINFYTSFRSARPQVFYYMVRAVTRGEFEYAPVVAEAMYDGEYYSASDQRRIRILP